MDPRELKRPDDRTVDDELIRRVADGDTTAWPKLVERHAAPITACAWRMLGDRAEAEDVTQEAFLRLFRKANDWRPGGPQLRTWLIRVATNLCIDRARSRRTVPMDVVQLDEIALGEDAPQQTRLDQQRALGAALSSLPVRQRGAVVLVHHQGLSQREAADALGVSVEALESLLSRARRSLKRQLSPLLEDLLSGP